MAEEEEVVQFTQQLYGARRWFVCTRGLRHTSLGGHLNCNSTMLRRGDLLHIPAHTRHWAESGPGASAHITWSASPLQGYDLVKALSAQHDLSAGLGGVELREQLALPMSLWRPPRGGGSNDTLAAVEAYCAKLPWPSVRLSGEVTEAAATPRWCRPEQLRPALRQFMSASDRAYIDASEGHCNISSGACNRSWGLTPRESVDLMLPRPSPLRLPGGITAATALGKIADCMAVVGALLFFAWLCYGIFGSSETKLPRERTSPRLREQRQKLADTQAALRATEQEHAEMLKAAQEEGANIDSESEHLSEGEPTETVAAAPASKPSARRRRPLLLQPREDTGDEEPGAEKKVK
eukprot:NODE_907_length_1316_cov_278.766852.p1 GENE.NODE_907_length_1316_cov_278.766852~~NODE_907_length_1316_cov_278.766852.p1  ORF type:complete len:400 (-),score=64.04 NODE_907_length_1316_cov_278.766852:102-1154(-)